MKIKVSLYPGTQAAEKEKDAARMRFTSADHAPDFIGLAPNYKKFDALHMPPEKVLAYLNID